MIVSVLEENCIFWSQWVTLFLAVDMTIKRRIVDTEFGSCLAFVLTITPVSSACNNFVTTWDVRVIWVNGVNGVSAGIEVLNKVENEHWSVSIRVSAFCL